MISQDNYFTSSNAVEIEADSFALYVWINFKEHICSNQAMGLFAGTAMARTCEDDGEALDQVTEFDIYTLQSLHPAGSDVSEFFSIREFNLEDKPIELAPEYIRTSQKGYEYAGGTALL
jgi:hypothetical protein